MNTTIQINDVVKIWDGAMGRVIGITADGWFQVRDLTSKTGRVDEWQAFQLTLMAKADGAIL